MSYKTELYSSSGTPEMSYKTEIYNSPEPIWELQEAAIVGSSQPNVDNSPWWKPDSWWLAQPRDFRQDAAYACYAKHKIYTAAQTLDLIDRWDIWAIPGEDEWGEFVDRVYRRAAIDDAEHLTREAQSLAEADNAQGLRQPPENGMAASYASGGAS